MIETVIGFASSSLGWVIGALVAAAGIFLAGKRSQKKTQRAEMADQLEEVIEDAQEHAARRADNSADPRKRLRDQSGR